MNQSKQIIFYLTLAILTSCSKEIVDKRNISYLNPQHKSYVLGLNNEYTNYKNNFLRDPEVGFYTTNSSLERTQANCLDVSQCQYHESFTSTFVTGVYKDHTVSVRSDSPKIILNYYPLNLSASIYLKNDFSDYDTAMCRIKGGFCFFYEEVEVDRKKYKNVISVGSQNSTDFVQFWFNKEYGVIQYNSSLDFFYLKPRY